MSEVYDVVPLHEVDYIVREKRADTTVLGLDVAATSTSGCVSCPTKPPDCPTCADGEQCVLTTQTCSSCPKTYCSKVNTSIGNYTSSSTSSSSSKGSSMSAGEIGGIAGGVSVFVFALIAVGLYFAYKRYFKDRFFFRREPLYDLDEDEDGNKIGDHAGLLNGTEKRMSQVTVGSRAASVFTKASNIINVAYIPGVTIKRGATRGPANSIYSRDSYFSDLENASIHGATLADGKTLDNTTTAIRAVPKLVSVNGLAHEEEDEHMPMTATSVVSLGGVRLTPANGKASNSKFQPGLQNDMILEEDEEEEEDDDEEEEDDEDDDDDDDDDDESVSDSESASDSDDSSYLRSSDEEDIDLIAEQHAEMMRNRNLNDYRNNSTPPNVLRDGIPIELVVSDEEEEEQGQGSYLLTVDFDQGSPFDDKFREE